MPPLMRDSLERWMPASFAGEYETEPSRDRPDAIVPMQNRERSRSIRRRGRVNVVD